jgi:hypothetical protein
MTLIFSLLRITLLMPLIIDAIDAIISQIFYYAITPLLFIAIDIDYLLIRAIIFAIIIDYY